jgi:hypothetical protein
MNITVFIAIDPVKIALASRIVRHQVSAGQNVGLAAVAPKDIAAFLLKPSYPAIQPDHPFGGCWQLLQNLILWNGR